MLYIHTLYLCYMIVHTCMYGYFENVGYFSQAVRRPLAKLGQCYLSLPFVISDIFLLTWQIEWTWMEKG